jgi:hypothetical protein
MARKSANCQSAQRDLAAALAWHTCSRRASICSIARPTATAGYRINNFFCRTDAWKPVLARLVREGDVVLMDLRSFAALNAGCVQELRHLIEFVPLVRCVFIIDRTTDLAHLRSVLDEAWRSIGAASPNRDASPDAVDVHPFDVGPAALRELLRRLCAAGLKARPRGVASAER